MSLRAILASLALGLSVAGCAAPANYPSLLPRAAEATSLEEPAPPEPVGEVADPALDTQIAEVLKTLLERDRAFAAAADRAQRQVTRAGKAAAGSEAWLDAQVALAELDTLRSATAELATRLDDLASERALSLAPPYAPLDAASERVRAASSAQGARIAALQQRLAPA